MATGNLTRYRNMIGYFDTLVVGGNTLSGGEFGALDGVTAGTAAANKAVVLGASKEIATITTATITTLNTTTANVSDVVIAGSIQNTNTTVVTADTSPGPTLTFTDGLNLISNTTNANDTVSLPVNVAGDIGKEIEFYAVEGFELISADASATINNVIVGATNELAIVAGTYVKLKLVADNTWLTVISTLIDGTQTQLVPDALA